MSAVLDLIAPQRGLPHIKYVERLGETPPGEKRRYVNIEYISPSALTKFRMCPVKYYLHYVDARKLRERPDSNLVRGSAVHEAGLVFLTALREDQRQGNQPDFERLLNLAKLAAQHYLDENITSDLRWKASYNSSKKKHTRETLTAAVMSGVELLAKERWIHLKPVELEAGYVIHWDEEHLPIERRTLPVLAYADIIEHRETESGTVAHVIDLKTGAKKTQDAIDLDMALTAHCAGYEVFHGIPTRSASYDNLVCNATPVLNELKTVRDERKVRRMYRIARALTSALRSGVYVPVDDDRECGGCDFRAECEAEFS